MLHFFGHGASDTRDKTQCCSVCNEALLNRFDTGVLEDEVQLEPAVVEECNELANGSVLTLADLHAVSHHDEYIMYSFS